MSQSQQEAYQVICKGTPQKLYQLFRLFSMLKQAAKSKEMKQQAEQLATDNWEKFKKLREQLGLPDRPELEFKFKQLPREKQMELIRDCEKKLLIKAGEKDYEFLLASNKMLAEPQLLNKEVNLDQLKTMLTEYGLQFHVKELPDQTMELHFYAKDANVATRALQRTIDEIVKDPDCVTKPTFEALIKQAKEQSTEKAKSVEKEKEASFQVGSEGTKLVGDSAKEAKETLDALSLFENAGGGIEL
ncbi:hypothetical protein Q1X24_15450 [Enterococcus sp. B1E4]|uniref:DUF3801 domain-containing protein n=1 Tax=Enterococcus sp. B1E4 TaxID=3061044 RepID=UPI00265BE2C3|nr:DUF3801 domain-containing protein [Enterococcus sp. B1E4]MDO0896252.1 hypothetical protein [Enterococcus sp. B1E4]